MKKILIVIAMREEAQGVFEKEGIEVLFTGLGKVNAAYALTKKLAELSAVGKTPDLVINFGTAGSPTFKTHSLIECTSIVQRDMDVTALGLKPGVTPFDGFPSELMLQRTFDWLEEGSCGTGDNFETGKPKVDCSVVDMEAYALAKVCAFEGLVFSCVKYITDGSDHLAANDWQANLPRAASAFIETYRRLVLA